MVQSEADVLRDCREYLDWCRASYKVTYRRISTGGVPARVSGKRVIFRKNEMAGMADLLIFLEYERRPHTLHVEVKRPNGKLSVEQLQWRDELNKCGHWQYYVVTSRDELSFILSAYGIGGKFECSPPRIS